MIKVRTEIVHVFEDEGHKEAVMFQNGHIEIFMLRKASKDQISQLLEADKPNE